MRVREADRLYYNVQIAAVTITKRPLNDVEIDLLMKDVRSYPDLVYVKRTRFQSFKNAYVIEEDGQFVGICGVYVVADRWIKLGPFAFLRKHQGKGYGKLLMNQIVSDHADKNVFITSSNVAEQRIIEAHNFQEVSGYLCLPWEVQLFLIKRFHEHLHIKLATEYFRKLFSMKRHARKYYIRKMRW